MAIDPREIILTPEQKRQLADLAERTGLPWSEAFTEAIGSYQTPATPSPQSGSGGSTFYDAMKDVIGIVTDAPADLSTNPKYMEGFGCDHDDRAD